MSEEFQLDENRPGKWQIMQHDTQMYMRRNNYKFEMASKQLLKEKNKFQKLKSYINQKISDLNNY